MNNKEYQDYVNKKTPPSSILKDCVFAFVSGGIICIIGQAFTDMYMAAGLSKEPAGTATSITLIFLGALLTGLNIYPKMAKYSGAGTIVPITGFANSVVSPALESKSEGYILGVGAKIFTIAGPVILYGTLASLISGLIYFIISLA